jgi:hypothetical protein
MQSHKRFGQVCVALGLGLASSLNPSVNGVALADPTVRFVGTGCDLAMIPSEFRVAAPLIDERYPEISDRTGTCYVFLAEGFSGTWPLRGGGLQRPDGSSTHPPGVGPATPGDPPAFILTGDSSSTVPPLYADVVFFPHSRTYPSGDWTLITPNGDGTVVRTQFSVGRTGGTQGSVTRSAPVLPVRSRSEVVGDLPGEGDHKGRDLYAVDFRGGGGGIVQTVAPGSIAYAGWNCQTGSPEQSTCYGFALVVDHGLAGTDEVYSMFAHLDCATFLQFSMDDAVLAALSDLCTRDALGDDLEIEAARGLLVSAGSWLGSISDSGCRDNEDNSHCVRPPGPDPEGIGKHLHFAMRRGSPGLAGAQALFHGSLKPINVWEVTDAWHLPGLPAPPSRGRVGPCWEINGPPDDSCLVGNAPITYAQRQELKHP